ncbi:MAG: CTP synthase [bacterium]|nr:CTP synthase [bacterium]
MAKAKKKHKYIFVIGGVMSGVGKGITTASIGAILQAKGFRVNLVKVDPYLNVDAGTMNPTEHGEVFVLKSGLETDQDMGNYERFLNRDLSPEDYMTSGLVYRTVLDKERALEYKGKFVEAIPHVTDEIRRRYMHSAQAAGSDITVVEIGGTVGDYQNVLFIEAARTLHLKNPDDVIFILVSYLPVPHTIGEMKTKPTQNAVRQLNSYGVQPHIIVARGPVSLDEKRKEKLAIWCNVEANRVISAPDIESIYEVPVNFEKDDLSGILLETLKLKTRVKRDGLTVWKKFVESMKSATDEVKIAVIGKYFDTGDFVLSDAYISVIEALKVSAYKIGKKPKLTWVNAKDFEKDTASVSMLSEFDGILVPGGFGETGIEGKLSAIRFAREKKIPYFGLCYGMQLAVVEYARNVVGLTDANTTEINKDTPHPVIDIMPEQKKHMAEGKFGATMRLGVYSCVLKEGTLAYQSYVKSEKLKVNGRASVEERHRHRYEVNPEYIGQLEKAGLVFSGTSPDGVLMEIAELPRKVHPFFLGTQFHPELQARPLSPHPLFTAFLKAAADRHEKGSK